MATLTETILYMPADSVRQLLCPVAAVEAGDDVSGVVVLCTVVPLNGGTEPVFSDRAMVRNDDGVPATPIGPWRAGARYRATMRADVATPDQEGVSVEIRVVHSSGASP